MHRYSCSIWALPAVRGGTSGFFFGFWHNAASRSQANCHFSYRTCERGTMSATLCLLLAGVLWVSSVAGLLLRRCPDVEPLRERLPSCRRSLKGGAKGGWRCRQRGPDVPGSLWFVVPACCKHHPARSLHGTPSTPCSFWPQDSACVIAGACATCRSSPPCPSCWATCTTSG